MTTKGSSFKDKKDTVVVCKHANDLTDTNNLQTRKYSDLWVSSKQNLPSDHSNVSYKSGKEELKSRNDLDAIKNSTLSLHISAYENFNETGDSFVGKNVEKEFTKSKLIKQLFTDSFSIIHYPFEFPRQQKEDQITVPEVIAYKTSQKLLNPNHSITLNNSQDHKSVSPESPDHIPSGIVHPSVQRSSTISEPLIPTMSSESHIPTPLWGKLDETVYEPSEDSFLLMDAFVSEATEISKKNPAIIVEIGVGSGVVTSFIRTLISSTSANPSTSTTFMNFGTDLNPSALAATSETAKLNNQMKPELIQCDLLSPFLYRWKGCIDILIFNPPYVPTENEPLNHLERCYAGGPTGRAALDRLIPSISTLLSSSGIFYLVALKSNNIPDIIHFASKYSLRGSIVIERRCGGEYLYILKFVKS